MSLTGRPSSPPLALISSAQICLDSRWALPDEARPPVRDTLNPILIGSCACSGATDPNATDTSATRLPIATRLHTFRQTVVSIHVMMSSLMDFFRSARRVFVILRTTRPPRRLVHPDKGPLPGGLGIQDRGKSALADIGLD